MKNSILLMLILTLITAGCKDSQEAESNALSITSENFETIAGVQWILQQMTIDGEAFELAGEKPFIQFDADENKVTGFASLNRFFGSFKIDEAGRVQWPGPFGSTRMAGSPQQMEQEDAFLKALPRTEWLSKAESNLHAISEDGKTKLVFYVLYTT